jgi:hypothetical protein
LSLLKTRQESGPTGSRSNPPLHEPPWKRAAFSVPTTSATPIQTARYSATFPLPPKCLRLGAIGAALGAHRRTWREIPRQVRCSAQGAGPADRFQSVLAHGFPRFANLTEAAPSAANRHESPATNLTNGQLVASVGPGFFRPPQMFDLLRRLWREKDRL